MQFKVPQNVQREDTIIGSVTIKQLIIVVIGGGIDYMIYIAVTNQGLGAVIWFPPVLIIGLLTIAFAFIKINNIAFHKYILLFIERLMTPQKRIWKKGEAEVYQGMGATKKADTANKAKKDKEAKKADAKQETLTHISRLSKLLDAHGMKEDVEHPQIDKTDDQALLHTAFETGKQSAGDIESHKKKIEKITARPKTQIIPRKEEPKKEEPKVQEAVKQQEPKEAAPVATKEPEPVKEEIPTNKEGEINLDSKSGEIQI